MPSTALKTIDASILEPLVTKLLAGATAKPFSIGFTATHREEGVTTIAVNLAQSLAGLHGRRVVLVDINRASPGLSRHFGLENHKGLLDAASDHSMLSDALHPQGSTRLTLLPIGQSRNVSLAALDEARLPGILRALRQQFDLAIFDCPPVDRFNETTIIAGALDAMIFVLSADQTRRALAQRALIDLKAAGGRPLGALVNRRQQYIPAWLYRLL